MTRSIKERGEGEGEEQKRRRLAPSLPPQKLLSNFALQRFVNVSCLVVLKFKISNEIKRT